LVTPKNVTNTSNPVTITKRVNNATAMVDMMVKMKNRMANTFFIDEASCNLANLRPSPVIRPTGRRAYRRWWKSQVTVSVTLHMCMRGDGTVFHYKLVQGGCNQTHALQFLKECNNKMSAGEDNVIFWDNAPAHGPATRHFSELPKNQQRATIIKTPPCTPDSNLVEYGFSSLKSHLRKGLEKEQLANQSVGLWIDYCTTICRAWAQSRHASASSYNMVLDYLKLLVKGKGNLNVLDQLLRPNDWDKNLPDIHTETCYDSPLSAEAHDNSEMSDE
jgi:transposase